MNITIHDVDNASAISEFTPVSGRWFLSGFDEERSIEMIQESVRNWMDVDFKIDVTVFHADGCAISDDVPASGTFLAVRR